MPEGVGCHEAAPKDLIRILKDDGWVIDRIKGSHH
ncbi:type II toxin-antitoxin system HicA family toxin, partial [Anaerovibrio sp.]